MAAVVELRTQLRKGGGGELTGRCPFHDERTPSFWLNPVKQLYYCFGCGAKGDLISFVRETEGLDFAEAVEWLADRFNVPLEYEEASPGQDGRGSGGSGCTPCSSRRHPSTSGTCGTRRRGRWRVTTSPAVR